MSHRRSVFGGSDGDLEYVESTRNLPTSLAIALDLAGHLINLETMYKVSEGDINTIVQPMVLFTHRNNLETTELTDDKTNSTKNHQDNGAKPLLGTKPSFPYSPMTDTSSALAKPLPFPHIEDGDTIVLARTGDLLDVLFLGANDMLFGVYQY